MYRFKPEPRRSHLIGECLQLIKQTDGHLFGGTEPLDRVWRMIGNTIPEDGRSSHEQFSITDGGEKAIVEAEGDAMSGYYIHGFELKARIYPPDQG